MHLHLIFSIIRGIDKLFSQTNNTIPLIDYYFSLNRNYLIYISTKKDDSWERVVHIEDSFYITYSGKIKKSKVVKYCIACSDGQIIEMSDYKYAIPFGTYWIDDIEGLDEYSLLSIDEVTLDSPDIVITHSKSFNPQQNYYTTSIKNNMNCKLYPVAFGGYVKGYDQYVLNNVINTPFSSNEFINWYDCETGYLLPQQTVSDPNNYGGDNDTYWIYVFKTEDNSILIVGSQIK